MYNKDIDRGDSNEQDEKLDDGYGRGSCRLYREWRIFNE